MSKSKLTKGAIQFNGWIRDLWVENKTALATRLGMSIEQLRHITSGRRPPTLRQAVAIEALTEIPPRLWV